MSLAETPRTHAQPLSLAVAGTTITPATRQVLLTALQQLSYQTSLSDAQIAAKCILTGTVPTFPTWAGSVVRAYEALTGGTR